DQRPVNPDVAHAGFLVGDDSQAGAISEELDGAHVPLDVLGLGAQANVRRANKHFPVFGLNDDDSGWRIAGRYVVVADNRASVVLGPHQITIQRSDTVRGQGSVSGVTRRWHQVDVHGFRAFDQPIVDGLDDEWRRG